ncbi:hypothetical protein VSH64_43445 [Amycolatopsis rhabdoformis]|uniref:DUF4878 domain-containing protein n=1 Tax=Amycolatopsis rhabdoformis TaxID=1448059 RepID=A0ABZ1I7U0_9PSEU|nr:hypothetical protein [Amycolatopsis rhabdoformis]WSE29584.1 hypothetical protein VSH64_43445 [Amycolatopsis rhabdoformis]
MPIRTNRGRAAVYRRLWGYPLRSPRHLVGTLVFLAIVITALGIALPKVMGKQATATPSAPGSTSAVTTTSPPPGLAAPVPTTATLPTRLSSPLLTPTSAPPNPEAINVAKQWATAWVNHPAGITNADWLNGMRTLTTDEFLPQMTTVDPANIPATRVTGDPTVKTSFSSSVEVLVPTDGPKLSITVVDTGAGWRVSDYDQAS